MGGDGGKRGPCLVTNLVDVVGDERLGNLLRLLHAVHQGRTAILKPTLCFLVIYFDANQSNYRQSRAQ